MLITSYNRRLAVDEDGADVIETDPDTGLAIVYSMGGAPDDRIHADAVNVTTTEVLPTPVEDREAKAEAVAAAWVRMQSEF